MSNRNLSLDQFGRHPEVPAEPGTTPVPEGHVRAMHSILSEPPSRDLARRVKREGLTMGHAKGETYGEPNQIWAVAGDKPYNETATNVEFSADPKELGIGNRADPEWLEQRRAHVTLGSDVSPDRFIGVHEPWHSTYRYITEDEDMRGRLAQGDYDDFLDDPNHPDEQRAVTAAKADLAWNRIRGAKRAVR